MSEGGKNLIRTDNLGGTWKATVKAKKIEDKQGVVVGNRTPLEYYFASSVKGDWLMLEYSCDSYRQNNKVDYALCKIYLTPTETKRRAEEAEDEKKKKKKKKWEIEEAEVIKALQEKLDQSLQDDVALQPPQLESSQPQQEPPSDAYQVPLDSYQQQPVIPNHGVAKYLGERVPQLQEELDQPPQQHPLSDAYQVPQDLHQQPPVIPYDEFDPQLLDFHGILDDEFQLELLEVDDYEDFMNCTGFLDDEFEDMINF